MIDRNCDFWYRMVDFEIIYFEKNTRSCEKKKLGLVVKVVERDMGFWGADGKGIVGILK